MYLRDQGDKMTKKELENGLRAAEADIVTLRSISISQSSDIKRLGNVLVGFAGVLITLFIISIAVSTNNNQSNVKEIEELKYKSMKTYSKIKYNKDDIRGLEHTQELLRTKDSIVKDCKKVIGRLKGIKHFKKVYIGYYAYCKYAVCKNKLCNDYGQITHSKIEKALEVLGED